MSDQRPIGFTTIAVTSTANKAFHCSELTFINKGSTTVVLDDCFPLAPNESITYPAWPNEINHTIYSIVFPRGVNGNLLIAICKIYMKE